ILVAQTGEDAGLIECAAEMGAHELEERAFGAREVTVAADRNPRDAAGDLQTQHELVGAVHRPQHVAVERALEELPLTHAVGDPDDLRRILLDRPEGGVRRDDLQDTIGPSGKAWRWRAIAVRGSDAGG